MKNLFIDPGPEHSAWMIFDGRPIEFGIDENDVVLARVSSHPADGVLVVEQVASFGMAVGAEVFETVFWSGRFCQAWRGEWHRLKRMRVKMALCHDSRAKDPNIRQALIDRFGGKDVAIGCKASPGPLYGVSKDCWSALAMAVTWDELTAAPAAGASDET